MLMVTFKGVIIMSENQGESLTMHAMLVVWGQFGHCLGLIEPLGAVPLHQKTVVHPPQTKVIEYLVATLGGVKHLQDISRSAHPLDQDNQVAKAWGQNGWADCSGVSRTLTELTLAEAQQIVQVLDQLSQPLIDQEVRLALHRQARLVYDGDLTGRPVSNTSTTYPNATYGHMDDEIRLGYQAALLSLRSPTYGRLWLSVTPHPGDTVSCTQAEALVLAAEVTTGMRPLRRTALVQQRLHGLAQQEAELLADVQQAEQKLRAVQEGLRATQAQVQHWQQQVAAHQRPDQAGQPPEHPHSQLGQAQAKLATYQGRQVRRERAVADAEQRLTRQQTRLTVCQAEEAGLQARLARYERDNATNAAPIQASFRLDAGFGTRANLALLIELGYEVYSKPYGTWLLARLKRQGGAAATWTPVGGNAEMLAWPALVLDDFPYPLDLALERFYAGSELRHSVLVHFGVDSVTTDLPGWFTHYNGRQTIEAGIKEGKGVFWLHHLKVRSAAALFLQEHFATFAANYIRWAALWLTTQCAQLPTGWQDPAHLAVKQQVAVGAHTSAWITWFGQDCLLRFTDHSVFAGRSLRVKREWAYQPLLPFPKSCGFEAF